MGGIASLLFGNAPTPPDPTKTAQQQQQYNTTAAQTGINMNSMDRNGPFGSSQFQRDANGNVIGLDNSLAPGLQGGANNVMGAFGAQTAGMPSSINFDPMTAQNIANQNYGAYAAMTQPSRDQATNALNTTLSERGIPIGSEIDTNARGNMDRANALADTSAAAQAWNAVPGMQATMTNTAIQQGMTPGALAGQGLGLLGAANGLTPQAQQYTAGVQAPDYTGLVNNNYNAQMGQYNANTQAMGSLLGTAAGIGLMPLTGGATGGLANSLFGKGVGAVSGMFNGK
jgi:hypothetical protein